MLAILAINSIASIHAQPNGRSWLGGAMPAVDNGVMVGILVTSVGELFAELGVTKGDVITHVNGEPASDARSMAKYMSALQQAPLELAVRSAEGSTRTVRYEGQERE